ncbi:MAG: nuclear transport factor 2 family protein [Thermomicrobiales bacterium]|nr:nuclear transport factor 2 family protein [Thermomicrobiales bacterium]
MSMDVVQQWHEAVNAADVDRVRRLVADQVVVNGPRGSGAISRDAFADWVIRSGIHLRPVEWRPVSSGVIVVGQQATWPAAPESASVATMFRVTGDHISAALRFPDLEQALEFAHLSVALAETA